MNRIEMLYQLEEGLPFDARHVDDSFPNSIIEFVWVDNAWLIKYFAKHRETPQVHVINEWAHEHNVGHYRMLRLGGERMSIMFGFESEEDALLFQLTFINS